MSYQVWKKDNVSSRNKLPEAVHYVIDTAIETAKKLSKGTVKKSIYNPNKKNPGGWDGDYELVEMPNIFIVIEKGDKQSSVRGFGISGNWFDAKDCKRCSNSGESDDGFPCNLCKGASFKPKV